MTATTRLQSIAIKKKRYKRQARVFRKMNLRGQSQDLKITNVLHVKSLKKMLVKTFLLSAETHPILGLDFSNLPMSHRKTLKIRKCSPKL